jgi:RNA polymerase sigma-70 factor (ECF subfamily)
VTSLPEHERIVIMLRYFENHEVAAVAAILGRPVGTVTKQLSRALGRLRRSLAEEFAL